MWTAGGSEDNKRSLGDKRRHITQAQIAEIVRLYGRQAEDESCRIFDNADFGYTRVTVERPLRLRYQMTVENKARFLDACPHLLADVQAIVAGAIGGEMAGETVEGLARFPINVRYPRELRGDVDRIRRVLVATPSGAQVPLGQLADVRLVSGPAMIRAGFTATGGQS